MGFFDFLGKIFGTGEGKREKELGQMSQDIYGAGAPGYKQAMDQYSKLAGGDKASLAAFTGTEVSDMNRMLQNQVNKVSRGAARGGGASRIIAEAPGELERGALGARLGAREFGLSNLGTLGLKGAQTGLQGEEAVAGLEARRRAQNAQMLASLGSSIGSMFLPGGIALKGLGKVFGGGGLAQPTSGEVGSGDLI